MLEPKNKLAGSMSYLIGPMDEVDDLGADWRAMMSQWLWDLDIGVLNPCDKPTVIAQEDTPTRDRVNLLKLNKDYDGVTKIIKEIVSVDLHLVDLSTFAITYVDKDIHMCGSYSEVTYASLEHKPNIVCCKQGKDNVPNWLYGVCDHNCFFGSWQEVKDYIRYVAFELPPDDKRWRFLDYNKIFNKK